MNIFNDHKKLYLIATLFFGTLTLFVAVFPSVHNEMISQPLYGSIPLTAEQEAGRQIYISNGCVSCHTQQVRDVDMDKIWGDRPNVASDYALSTRKSIWQSAGTLMGTERTGPDLSNIGVRQPSQDWHLVHLYNPRIVMPQSIMAPFPWLFEIKDKATKDDIKVNVPEEFMHGQKGIVVATKDALNLVAYLQSLKQVKLPDGMPSPEFLYKKAKTQANTAPNDTKTELNGSDLYAANCMACHQQNGEGLNGAFPALKASKIVLDDNPEIMVGIIMNGYNPREEYGVMPPVGINANLSAQEIAAIMNHEKSSWGNNAKKVTPEQVQKLMDLAKLSAPKQ
ncbi:cytochrome c [Flavobacterium psychrophilum]|uniref:cytochrome c n=1 Tax=Flavobacterium psychrophilum TaxID=96345 RepID=UPI000903F69B|nr:cbb3-type cytochrome c oxidase subunit II [Flavobacterium psychrophilum]EKT4500483.1 cytochrome c [Flavobacterium psychrophilum]EKT4520580.1 cytochrome c [Flavobacterium psychrophilum]EKT4549613.1 cytochrome c [Flavobacterium psychrophilum]ELY2010803.1 cytochrome c [Flavobacterium psychrophilum]MCB5995139.1 cytochrome c [Flavobacterium psychrophilum]